VADVIVIGTAAICGAISARRLIEFDYKGKHRIVAPYCHGAGPRGQDLLRAVQLERPNSLRASGGFGFGKLWMVREMHSVRMSREPFEPDDHTYDPDDSGIVQIHCRI
jgi:hypothetical protein